LWIFRDGKKTVFSRDAIAALENSVRSASAGNSEAALDSLIQAGELESALADVDSPAAAVFADITGNLAGCFLGDRQQISEARRSLTELAPESVPTQLTVSPPEGFAFYALSPLDFAIGLTLPIHADDLWAVIGIRSIGTTLSALARASLQKRGCRARRITVRPTGHPFDRVTHLDSNERFWVHGMIQREAHFLIVDEGPGMSGSSFLSVAEALEREGVRNEQIYLVGSRDPDVQSLRAPDAARRWRRYHWQCVTSRFYEKFRGFRFFGADDWRARHFSEHEWPACWTQMERLKFLSAREDTLYKFEGLGRFGREVRARSKRLAEAGFGATPENAGEGMSAYPYIVGRPLCPTGLTPEILDRIAKYCAYRRSFHVAGSARQQLPEMLAFNLEQEFGVSAVFDLELLVCGCPIVADGRMQTHEWMRALDGRLIKLDSSTHGDDHFFPGPTDIAWDLAGAIVEWRMNRDATEHLVRNYRRLAGDDPGSRLPTYLLAYSVFRMGYCKMAAEAEKGTAEAGRLERSYRHYRQLVENELASARHSRIQAA
jgi:hypothetical protein